MDSVVVDNKVNGLFFSLKKINRVLRWTGVRLTVSINKDFFNDMSLKPETKIGFTWYGWGFIKDLKNDLPL